MLAKCAIIAALGLFAQDVASFSANGRAYLSAAGLKACPEPCDISGDNPNNWTTFHDSGPFTTCKQKPMLLDFSIRTPLNDPDKPTVIRGCTTFRGDSLGIGPTHIGLDDSIDFGAIPVGVETIAELEVASSNFTTEELIAPQIITAAKQIQATLLRDATTSNVSATYFAHYGDSVVGVYVGGRINPRGVALKIIPQFIDHVRTAGRDTARTHLIQLCGTDRDSDYVVGIIGDSTSGISALSQAQRAVGSWSEAKCVTGLESVESLGDSTVWLTGQPPNDRALLDGILPGNATAPRLYSRDVCPTIKVVSGDSCGSLAQKCGIPGEWFEAFNTVPNLCSTLKVGQLVCCWVGDLPSLLKYPNPDGSCYSYTVQSGDWCDKIATENGLTVADLEFLNKQTWGWSGCDNLYPNINICLSFGAPPMPPPLANAVCGPQKPGTPKAAPGTKLADLNPCPLKTCCNVWGQCGTTVDFCVEAPLGAPGTTQPGKNSCISNCGMNIVNNQVPPSQFISVGYFEAWNKGRSCLRMDITQMPSSFTHVHFAFGDVTSNFEVSVSAVQDQFDKFVALQGKKRILAFGGWAASTESGTYWIFREGVKPQNRERLATNLANFIIAHKLDGIDLDWEYPGAPDIPGIPAADPIDGPNYLELLRLLRNKLPGKSLSIAAPASYWYLKAFPIEEIGRVVDYIVYMTYDLHGQWDYGSSWASPGCPAGNCLRSHVNFTETINALSMVTKAGVPSYKIVVGVTSYGRSFRMSSPGCTGPMCTFTGPQSGAKPGRCTGVAGYISNAEIKEIFATNPSARRLSDNSFSDVLVYDNDQWVAYMDADNKRVRTETWRGYNFGGISDWAADLESFMPGDGDVEPLPSEKCNWKALDCTHPGMTDASKDSKSRWEQLCSNTAFFDAMEDWKAKKATTSLRFASHVSNFFHGPEEFHCHILVEQNGCRSPMDCSFDGSDTGPAAMFILNNFVQISNLFRNLYEGLTDAQSTAGVELGSFAQAFLPAVAPDAFTNVMLNFLGAVMTVGAATPFNHLAKMGSRTNLKDSTMAAIAFSTATAKDVIAAGGLTKYQGNKIAEGLVHLVGQLKVLATKMTEELFSGKDSSIKTLEAMMKDGQLIKTIPDTAVDIENSVMSAYYTFLIPHAWKVGGMFPVVITTDLDCTKVGKGVEEWISTKEAEKASVCIQDKLYYLLIPRAFHIPPSETPSAPFVLLLETPPGFDKINNSNNFRGVTKKTLVESAVGSWKAYGNKKDSKPYDPSKPEVFDRMYDAIEAGNLISAPGVVDIPVCSAEEAMKNYETYSLEETKSIWPAFPCNLPPA